MNKPKIPLATAGVYINVKLMNTSEQLELRRKLAKRINQRMVRLEKKGLTKGAAYADYQDLLNKFFDGAKRIPENTKIYRYLPRTELKSMQTLLREKTSTVQGWNDIMDARVRTIKERYGVEFNDNYELYDFITSLEFKNLSKLYDSKQALRLIAHSQEDIDDVRKMLSQFRDSTDKNKADLIAKKLGFSGEADALKYKG
jgi:hypothetical protein